MRADIPQEKYLEAVEAGARRLVDVAAGRLGAGVPSCPDWTVTDLVDHLGNVYTFFTAQVVAADCDERHEPVRTAPGPDHLLAWFEAKADELVGCLRSAGTESPCWNWSGHDLTTAWVGRRMALETVVHRYDGELVAGDPTPVAVELAVDGLDERINVHLRADVPDEPDATLGGSLCLSCSDADAAFVVEVGRGRLHVHEGAGPASAFVRGSASDLFLFSWNRVPLAALDVTGDRDVAAAWTSLPV
jgi:uncharacterized protein (TIGR03083 family)